MKTIKIDHIGKTEGHLGFEGALETGDMSQARIVTLEGARLMEGIILNRSYYDVPIITSRICGVCPIVHNLAAIKALEVALDVKPTHDIVLLRKIFNLGQMIHSHALHLFFLSFPDFIGISNNFDLIKKYPNEVKQALEARDWGVKLCDVIGGRATHPINSVVGGFKVEPDKKELRKLAESLDGALNLVMELFGFVKNLVKVPEFNNPTNFISLKNNQDYSEYDGDLYFSDTGKSIPAKDYAFDLQEISLPYEAVKRVEYEGRPFMVGALARVNNNFDKLTPLAKQAWESLNVKLPCYNTFYNTLAQAVEVVYCFEEIKKLLKQYLEINSPKLFVDFKPRAGKGVGAIEAPRGTLFHYYELNANGVVTHGNIITPTAQFLANLENDLKVFLPQITDLTEDKQKLMIKTLVRAYDPCISCATH
jgi:sulfhydrogenase subunit alpha